MQNTNLFRFNTIKLGQVVVRSLSSSTSPIISKFNDGVHNITLNSTKTRNALSLEVMKELRSTVASKLTEADLRCVVLRSEGKVFSAGHNLKELTSEDGKQHHIK